MKHPERKLAKRFDYPGRRRGFTDVVYGGEQSTWNQLREWEKQQLPAAPEYKVFFGDLHGHTRLSDGGPTVDEYYTRLRDEAKLDFAALSDHDHGGVGKPELFGEKWELTKAKAKEYNDPGKFTTILAYERDSYPWFNNLVVYFNNYDAEMLRGEHDGEMTRAELHEFLAREDLFMVPHDTHMLTPGSDFLAMDVEDMTPMIQVCSRGSYAEKMGLDDKLFFNSACEGGFWQDALRRGAKMGCIGASDDHDGSGGLNRPERGYPLCFPGLTGVWAKENTLPAIFEALKARRCYAFMGGRITVDFRINGHYMGEEITDDGDREIYYHVEADGKVDTVTLVKNCRDVIVMKGTAEQMIYDYRPENETDFYYLRVKLTDGRYAWTSPIWINKKEN